MSRVDTRAESTEDRVWQIQTDSRWFFRRRKASLEKRGERLREREGVTQLPVLTFITHTVQRVLGTIGPHP